MSTIDGDEDLGLKRKSPVPFLLGGGAVVAAVALALVLADRRAEAKKKEAVDGAWSKLATCLVGPLGENEKPSARLRAIQVANAIDDPKVPASERWPIVCEPHAANLQRVLASERMTKAAGDDLAAATADIDKKLTGPEARTGDLGTEIESLFARAKAEGRALVKVDVPTPKTQPTLLSFDDLKKAKPLSNRAIGPKSISRELHRGRGLTFLATDESIDGRTRLCAIDENGTKAVCKKLHPVVEAVHGEPLLLSSRDAEVDPLVSFGHASSLGAYAAETGARAIEGDKFGWAWRRRDGHVVSLGYRNEYDKKLRLSIDGKLPGLLLTPPGKVANENLYYAATLVPGFVLWRGLDTDGEAKLWSQPLALDGGAGPTEVVGPIGFYFASGEKPQWRSCQSDRGAVAVMLDEQHGAHVTVEKDGKWTIPALAPAQVKLHDLACHAGTMTTTWTTETGIEQVSCAHGICDIRRAELPKYKALRRVVDLDGVVAMIERPEPRSGYHLAVAPIGELATQKTTPLFDDFSHDAKIPWLQEVALESLGGAALAILYTTEGTYFVRIGKDAKVTPIDVQL